MVTDFFFRKVAAAYFDAYLHIRVGWLFISMRILRMFSGKVVAAYLGAYLHIRVGWPFISMRILRIFVEHRVSVPD